MEAVLDQLLVYHPSPWEDRDWARVSGLPLEDVWFDAPDGTRLFGWYVRASGSPAVLLWCHGNAGNIIHRLENLALLYRAGLSAFLFDYRGYGRSRGTPSEDGLYQDALAAYECLVQTKRVPPERIVLFGRSLGGAVAGALASQRAAAGLILESTFPSVEALARFHYGGLPAHWLVSAEFNLTERLRTVHMPVLVIHGDRDRTVPIQMGRMVFEGAHPPKDLYVVPGADHNDLVFVGGAPYFERLRRFVKDVSS
ncbi:MAG: alpha/beta hydrolase [Nitrospirae bacterium]|nr:MAG: alpha/beta hydrolase [Nitrospirota bacterium]